MYPTSEAYKQAITSHVREGHKISISIGDIDINENQIESVSFSHICNDDEYMKFGSVASKKVELTFIDTDGTLKKIPFNAKEITITYELAGQSIPIGVFVVDGDAERGENNAVKITAFDRLYFADKRYFCMLGQSYTGKDLLLDVIAQASIELADQAILSYINMDLAQKYVPENISCRQIISFCAELCGCNAVMTRDDKLNFLPLLNNAEINGELLIENCHDMTFSEEDFLVDGLRYYESDDSFLKAGNGKKRIVCLEPSNFLVNQKVIDNLYQKVGGLMFRPFKITRYDGDPAIDAYDLLSTTSLDHKTTYHIVPTVITWSFTGGLKGGLENTASTSANVEPKNTTTLEQKINNTYYEKAGITYAYNNEKIVLGMRDSTLCDIKFANSYGNVPTGAIGISGMYTPSEEGAMADITMRFKADKVELPYHPTQHLSAPGQYVIYAPLVMYMLASGDHYFQAYASISDGSFSIDAEQFQLHVLTIGTGGGMKSPDTYMSVLYKAVTINPAIIDNLQFGNVKVSVKAENRDPLKTLISYDMKFGINDIELSDLSIDNYTTKIKSDIIET